MWTIRGSSLSRRSSTPGLSEYPKGPVAAQAASGVFGEVLDAGIKVRRLSVLRRQKRADDVRLSLIGTEYEPMRALSDAQVKQFIRDGFVRIDRAFPRELADEARAILWRDTGCEPRDPTTWTKPVTRLGGYSEEPF
jgi:hypothetical protein